MAQSQSTATATQVGVQLTKSNMRFGPQSRWKPSTPLDPSKIHGTALNKIFNNETVDLTISEDQPLLVILKTYGRVEILETRRSEARQEKRYDELIVL
jgi:hypothetical protein